MGMLRGAKNEALLWIGEQKYPIKEDRKNDFVMDSVINYYRDVDPKLNYSPGKLFLDNGAFTARTRGIDLDVDRVISLQESFDPDLTIPLDYPFLGGTPVSEMSQMWRRTADNILYWQNSSNLNGRLVPSLHAWSKSSLKENIEWLQKHADSDMIGLGSIVNENFNEFKSVFGDRQPTRELVDLVSLALSRIEKGSDFKVHMMGWGSSPLMLHLGYYLGIKSLDSAGYRRKAAYGKIILPGRGERHLGITSSSFSSNMEDAKDKNDLYALLNQCTCPICITNQYALYDDWKARAIHNEWVMKQEGIIAENLLQMGIDVYEKYLDNVVFSKSGLKYLWKYTKLRKKYHRISDVLFE